jgi:hypothetical protein
LVERSGSGGFFRGRLSQANAPSSFFDGGAFSFLSVVPAE